MNRRATRNSPGLSSPNALAQGRNILLYLPNEVGRKHRKANSKTIGVIVQNLYDPFFATCAQAIFDVAKQYGYFAILVISVENPVSEQHHASLMLRQQVDGLVVISVSGSDCYCGDDALSGVHLVILDGPASGSKIDSVRVPDRSGAKSAVEHLIGHGHRSIPFLGLSRKMYTMKARYAGYREAMFEAGHSPEPYIECGSLEEAKTLVHSMMNRKKPPTALFAANSLTMFYVLKALREAGIQVPGQIAIVGFDDSDMADVLQPSLTVIRQPVYQLGEMAANLLFQRIVGREASKTGRRVVLPLELVVRSSCGCKPPIAKGTRKRKSLLKELTD